MLFWCCFDIRRVMGAMLRTYQITMGRAYYKCTLRFSSTSNVTDTASCPSTPAGSCSPCLISITAYSCSHIVSRLLRALKIALFYPHRILASQTDSRISRVVSLKTRRRCRRNYGRQIQLRWGFHTKDVEEA